MDIVFADEISVKRNGGPFDLQKVNRAILGHNLLEAMDAHKLEYLPGPFVGVNKHVFVFRDFSGFTRDYQAYQVEHLVCFNPEVVSEGAHDLFTYAFVELLNIKMTLRLPMELRFKYIDVAGVEQELMCHGDVAAKVALAIYGSQSKTPLDLVPRGRRSLMLNRLRRRFKSVYKRLSSVKLGVEVPVEGEGESDASES